MLGKDGNRYYLKVIKEAEMRDGKLVIVLNGKKGPSEIRLREPTEKDIEIFAVGKPVILVERGLLEVVGLMEVNVGYVRSDKKYGKLSLEPVDDS